ncbi:MAG TPA: helix-turn-helix domain-containing protein [Thermoplasmata archaeon]|nr:helix-turn-helix domain-containing protein [Thermoplasmata archaeon]
MRRATPLAISPEERRELRGWLRGPATAPRLRVRAQIVLAAADRGTNARIAQQLRVTPETVARWRDRFRALGVDGLRREAPRAGGRGRTSEELVEQVLTATVGRRAPGAVAWTTRSLARTLRTNHMSVHRIWKRYGLSNPDAPARSDRPSRTRADLVGVYRGPGASAVVFGLAPAGEARAASAARPRVRIRASPSRGTVDIASIVAQLNSALAPNPSGERSVGPSPSSLLVFLRAVEERTPVPSRLDAVFDRPLASLDGRVGTWLGHHPRYRVFTTEPGDEWTRSTEAWLRRWEHMSLDPQSFQGVDAFRAVASAASATGPRAGSRSAWTLRPASSPRRGPGPTRRSSPTASRAGPTPRSGRHHL